MGQRLITDPEKGGSLLKVFCTSRRTTLRLPGASWEFMS